jgi:hypothetical protein
LFSICSSYYIPHSRRDFSFYWCAKSCP